MLICNRCQKIISKDELDDDDVVRHGCCRTCLDSLQSELKNLQNLREVRRGLRTRPASSGVE